MAATAVDREAQRSEGRMKAAQMAAVKIPKGCLVITTTATGYVTNGSDAASSSFAGVSYEGKDNSAGAAGAQKVRLEKYGEYLFNFGAGNATQAMVGQEACITDNQSVDLAATTVNDIKCGVIREVVSAGLVRVCIDGYAK